MEVEHIPGGYTSLCQTVDVGNKRSIKANICKDWEDWMAGLGISVSITKPPTRKLIVKWVMQRFVLLT